MHTYLHTLGRLPQAAQRVYARRGSTDVLISLAASTGLCPDVANHLAVTNNRTVLSLALRRATDVDVLVDAYDKGVHLASVPTCSSRLCGARPMRSPCAPSPTRAPGTTTAAR